MRVDLNVPYSEKDRAKDWGAMFDRETKTWYVTNPLTFEKCREWLDDPDMECPPMETPRNWIWISYYDRASRPAGARWDPDAKCWYIP